MLRKALWVLAIVVLIGTGILGVWNAVRERRDMSLGVLQSSVIWATLLYGFVGISAGWRLAMRTTEAVTLTTIWAVLVTYTATVASFVFHDPTMTRPGTLSGTLGAFVGSSVATACIVWICRRNVRKAATVIPES